MPTPPHRLVPQAVRNRIARTLPSGHTLIDQHWHYYRTVMAETWRSETTIETVGSTIRFFLRDARMYSLESWMEGTLAQEAMLDLKRSRGWSATTYNTYRKSMLSYFQVLADGGLVRSNPVRRIRKCAEPTIDQPRLGKDQVPALFGCLAEHPKGMPYLLFRRNYLFFLLAYYTGARPVELLSLKLGSWSENYAVLRVVWAKGNGKSRSFRLGADVQAAVTDYVRECVFAGRLDELHGSFFLANRPGNAWTYTGVRQVCRVLGTKLGFNLTPYMLRRMVASQLFEMNLPVQDIQHHLGHLRASTTLRYVQGNQDMTRAGIAAMAGLISDLVPLARPGNASWADAVLLMTP